MVGKRDADQAAHRERAERHHRDREYDLDGEPPVRVLRHRDCHRDDGAQRADDQPDRHDLRAQQCGEFCGIVDSCQSSFGVAGQHIGDERIGVHPSRERIREALRTGEGEEPRAGNDVPEEQHDRCARRHGQQEIAGMPHDVRDFGSDRGTRGGCHRLHAVRIVGRAANFRQPSQVPSAAGVPTSPWASGSPESTSSAALR